MPIQLDNIEAMTKTVKSVYSPKFFNNKLTGVGKKSGVLCADRNPAEVIKTNSHVIATAFTNNIIRETKVFKNGSSTVTTIPFALFPKDIFEDTSAYTVCHNAGYAYAPRAPRIEMDTPDMTKYQKIGTIKNSDIALFVNMKPDALILEEIEQTSGPKQVNVDAQYRMFLYAVDTKNTNKKMRVVKSIDINPNANTVFAYITTINPFETLNDIVVDLMSYHNAIIDKQAVSDFLMNYSLYDGISAMSEMWQTKADELLEQWLSAMQTLCTSIYSNARNNALTTIAQELRYLENYPIPLELYKKIYWSLANHFPNECNKLCKQNLNLLLSDTLYSLNAKKQSLIRLTPQPQNVPQFLQKFSKEQQAAITSTEPLILVQAGAGTGKALPLDEPVLTPNGWIPMGDLKVGDAVIGSNGKPCKILRIHEQGVKTGYKLTFRDGSSVRTCGEHLWTVHFINHGKESTKTLTTQEWLDSPSKDKYYIPQVAPVDFATKNLPIDPYLLGALLADGNLADNSIGYTKSKLPVIQAVKEAATRDGLTMYEITSKTATARHWAFCSANDVPGHYNELKNRLKQMNLLVKSHDKFIPTEYLTANIEQRKMLVHGLFDGDGRVRTGRSYARYSTTSERLANDVLQLLWSLGLIAKKQLEHHAKGDYWIVNLLDSYNPFFASNWKDKVTGTVKTMRRSLVKYESINPVPMRCIEVDATDKLYVTKDYIVTHNSSVILGRIDYAIACGVDPHDITVLSFTNAAADHITALKPTINSMTIARMIHSIYELNFSHELSSLDTIVNALDIYFPKSKTDPLTTVAQKLKPILYDLIKDATKFTVVNNFIEEHYDDVIKILDTINQTSMELEIIICYQKIDTLKEPDSVTSKFLIIDEVQDNSIFEFIYALRYVNKHNESLFIVGDCSQTLYEFRASNPKALNILEGSNVFDTHRLQINYRSNQEILDFANVILNNIEANQYAQIQLHANSLAPVTAQSFTEKVKFQYECLPKIKDFDDALAIAFHTTINDYINDKLAKGEKVAILAFTRKTLDKIANILQATQPNATVVNLVPRRIYNSTVFSTFVKKYWYDSVNFAPTNNIMNIIAHDIMDHLSMIVYSPDKMQPLVQKALAKWIQENKNTINNWQMSYNAGNITKQEFLDLVKDNLIQFEIKENAVKQSLVSAENSKNKQDNVNSNANIFLSTIHSAKGLEFDNVVVLYRNENSLDEDKKRMYYVALTRAMKSEYVFAYDTTRCPKIETDYNSIVQRLSGAPAPVATQIS